MSLEKYQDLQNKLKLRKAHNMSIISKKNIQYYVYNKHKM